MTTTINADTIVGGAIVTGDASGQLGLQAAGVTALTLNSTNATFNKALLETATITAAAPAATQNFDAITQQVQYFTTNTANNWTLNVRGNGSVSLNTLMAVGQSLTLAVLATNGGTAYYASALTIDGSAVTPKWQGGTAPSSGNASSVDSYVYTVIKTASATYTVLASQTKFA